MTAPPVSSSSSCKCASSPALSRSGVSSLTHDAMFQRHCMREQHQGQHTDRSVTLNVLPHHGKPGNAQLRYQATSDDGYKSGNRKALPVLDQPALQSVLLPCLVCCDGMGRVGLLFPDFVSFDQTASWMVFKHVIDLTLADSAFLLGNPKDLGSPWECR
jgi:hypothetical protein